jgi:hypothetical protein
MNVVAALLASVGLFAASPVKATLLAPTHSPKVNTHWKYSVRVTENGKAAAARITVQIVDPLGGVHPVQFGSTTKNVTRWPVHGVFRDYVIWPASSRGIPVTFRVTVVVGKVRRVIRYAVTARA